MQYYNITSCSVCVWNFAFTLTKGRTFRVKISVFWVVTTCSLVHRNQPYGRPSCYRPKSKNFVVLHPRRLQCSYLRPTKLQKPHRLFQNKVLGKKYGPKRQPEVHQELYILYCAPCIIFRFTTAWRNSTNNAPIWTIMCAESWGTREKT